MKLRTALLISAGALVVSYLAPGRLALWIMTLLRTTLGDEGWSFISYIVIGSFSGLWLQGMLWGLAFFAPYCALQERLSPDRVNARKLLLGLMGLWAVPAMFVPLWVVPAMARVGLTRPQPTACIAHIDIDKPSMVVGENGAASFEGIVTNTGDLHVDLLEVEFTIYPRASQPTTMDTVRHTTCAIVRGPAYGSGAQTPRIDPHARFQYRCVAGAFEPSGNPPIVEPSRILKWGCEEMGHLKWN